MFPSVTAVKAAHRHLPSPYCALFRDFRGALAKCPCDGHGCFPKCSLNPRNAHAHSHLGNPTAQSCGGSDSSSSLDPEWRPMTRSAPGGAGPHPAGGHRGARPDCTGEPGGCALITEPASLPTPSKEMRGCESGWSQATRWAGVPRSQLLLSFDHMIRSKNKVSRQSLRVPSGPHIKTN